MECPPGLAVAEAAADPAAQHLPYGSAIVQWVPHCSPVLRTVRGFVPLFSSRTTVPYKFRFSISDQRSIMTPDRNIQ